MNRMYFEAIKHEEAKKAAEGTKFDWTDLLDNTEQYEAEAKRMDEADMHKYWNKIFKSIINSMEVDG